MTVLHRVIAIIPARKGSKRLPNKNTKMICGKPMIEYTIEEACKSRWIDTIIISSDDNNVKEIWKKYMNRSDTDVIFSRRPKHLRGDDASMEDTLKNILMEFKYLVDEESVIVLLQPTSPLRLAEDIDRCVDIFFSGRFSSVVTVKKTLKGTYRFNGAVYVTNEEMIEQGKIYDENMGLVIMPYERSADVDRIEDFELCEFYLSKRK